MQTDKVTSHFLPVRSIMTTEVVYVLPDMPIFDAIRLLPEHKVSGLPVVDEEMNLVGILSEKDVLGVLIQPNLSHMTKVSQYMTRTVVSFQENDNAVAVARFFQRSPIRRVPITRDGKLIGVVSRRDIIKLILEARSLSSLDRYS